MKDIEDFFGGNMKGALEANKKMLDAGMRSFGDLEAKVMQNKEHASPEVLEAFEKAQKEIREAKEKLNNIK